MQDSLGNAITRLFQTRDELSFRNIRGKLWPLVLIFPLSVIMGDLRYFNLDIAVRLFSWDFQSWELMLYPLGLGWLVLAFVPRKQIIPLLLLAAVCSAVLLPFQFLFTQGMERLAVFMAFQFFNGICAACAFFIFCFELNNIERLFGMAMIMFYYGFYYTVWRAFPAVQAAGKTWGGAAVMAVYLITAFFAAGKSTNRHLDIERDGKGSGAQFVIGLDIVYYMIMCSINYIEWQEKSISSKAMGFGMFASIAALFIIKMILGRSALYSWLLFLAFSLLGLGALIFDSSITNLSGSFIYGLGDGMGYIVIYYLCAGVIKRSKSLKMFRLYCLVFFVEYFFISGIYARAYGFFVGPKHLLAFGIVLVLCSVCFLLVPLMQRKFFEAAWTDGINLSDVAEYTAPLAETEIINAKDGLDLTAREQEIFTLLLAGAIPKEIAYTIKVSYHTVNFHMKNLYRKLGIQNRAELFVKYAESTPHVQHI